MYILNGFDGEETKQRGTSWHKIQVKGRKLTDIYHVASGIDCKILLGVNRVSGCGLSVTKELIKIKKSSREKKSPRVISPYTVDILTSWGILMKIKMVWPMKKVKMQ